MPFPVASDYNYAENGSDNKKMQEALNYAIMQYESRGTHQERLRKLYNSHNGIVDEAEIAAITKFTGKQSTTKYVKYRLGRSKIKLLHGEFLMLPLEPQVRTINQDSQNEKMDKYKTALGMAYAKPQLQQVREMGFNALEGMKLPDINDKAFWSIDNFKLANEIIMQVLIDKKIKKDKIKMQFFQNFIDLTIASEVYGKVEKNVNGKTNYRVINPKYAIYEDSVYDPLLDRSPYMGEKRMMYYHEIVNDPNITISEKNKKRLKELAQNHQTEKVYGSEKIGSELAFPVYNIEWKGLEKVVRKIEKTKNSNVPFKSILSEEYFEKNKKSLQKAVNKGEFNVEAAYREILWSACRIGSDIYSQARIENDLIQVVNSKKKYNVEFNYTGYLLGTTDGERVSIQELVYELERVYDDIRFQINKELKKLKGNVLLHDDAFKPKGKRFIDIYHDIDEKGILRYNSSAEGNESGRDMERDILSSTQLGSGEPLRILVEQAMQVEHTMDKITGLNENRQGLAKATMTATANMNNIEASRSITYDLFYSMTHFMERVLMKITEKEKLCIQDEDFIFDETQNRYLTITKDLKFANYYPYLTDGREEQLIRDKLEAKFDSEINAGNLRSSDVAKFLRESSFSKALKILDEANQELSKIRMEEIQASQQSKQEEIQAQIQMAQEDREDRQEHEKEMEVLKTEGKKEVAALQESIKATTQTT